MLMQRRLTSMRAALGILALVASSGCSVFGIRSGTSEPDYTVLRRLGDGVELRRYGPRLAADTLVEGSEEAARGEGFRRLAGYIFGGNRARQSIAMTAPVGQNAEGGRGSTAGSSARIAMTAPVAVDRSGDRAWRVRFFMPKEYSLATLPVPDDSKVMIFEVPEASYAVRRFSGSTARDAVAMERDHLLQVVASAKLAAVGPVTAWFYDPPWTLPFLRRNEVAVAVDPKGS